MINTTNIELQEKIMRVLLIIILIILVASCQKNYEDEVKECLDVHSQTFKATKNLSVEGKYSFMVEFWTQYGEEEQLKILLSKRQEFIENPESATAYLELILMKWTEDCVMNLT
jgi:hypothetical protein